MNYFAEDGPQPLAPNQATEEEMKAQMHLAEGSKERFLKFFMVDYIEMTMRKVANQNTIFCANKAKLFDNLMNEDLTAKAKKK